MRRMSWRRRRLVVLASSVASMSGMGPQLLQHHSRMRWAWLGLVAALLVWVIVLMARLRRDEGCA